MFRLCLYVLSLFFLCTAAACTSGRPNDSDDGEPENTPSRDRDTRTGSEGDATDDVDDVWSDSGSQPNCTDGESVCVTEGSTDYQQCVGGQWQSRTCETGHVCLEGGCVPVTCTVDQRMCSGDRPIVCVEGEGWVLSDPCDGQEQCYGGYCLSESCADAALERSYLGCNYWAIDLPNLGFDEYTPNAPFGIVLASSSPDTDLTFSVTDVSGSVVALLPTVTVEGIEVQSEIRDSDGTIVTSELAVGQGTIPPSGMAVLLFTHSTVLSMWSSDIAPLSRHIITTEPVAAYQFSPYCCSESVSNDASLLLPVDTWGDDYRFAGAPAWYWEGRGRAYPIGIVVISANDSNNVSVRLPEGVELATPAIEIGVSETVEATLDTYDVLLLNASEGDLSGAVITADEPVAVLSSHYCTRYPHETQACDHLEEQLIPTQAWGTRYELVPAVSRNHPPDSEAVYWKFVAGTAGALISLSVPFDELGPLEPGAPSVRDCADFAEGNDIMLGENWSCEFGTDSPVIAESNQPIMVMGILLSQDAVGGNIGDPAIFTVPPSRQYRDEYTFMAPTTYDMDYLTVIADPDAELWLDDELIDLSLGRAVPGGLRVFRHIPIEDGPHRVWSDLSFGILAVAYDRYVSYAFTGGLNLTKY